MNNLTAVFHQERIPDTQILSSFCGKFIPIIFSSYIDPEEQTIDQICVQYSSKIKIYKIKKEKEKDKMTNKLELLNTYEVFDKILYSEKFRSLLNNKNINSIILSLSSYKISFIEYNMLYDSFNTLALYSIDQFLLGGKINIEKAFKIVSSLTYNYIIFMYDENKLSVLRKKKEDKKNNSLGGVHTSADHSYSDTINGDKYFFPTVYLNDLNTKYNIYKIINIYIPKKNSELFYFNNSNEENKSKIQIYILYIESKSENIEINNDNKINNNDIDNNKNENIENQIIFNSYMRDKVSLGLLSYNLKSNEYTNFEILFSGIDENAFDFTVLEKSNSSENIALVFSAYNLQIINIKSKTTINYIMNMSYDSYFSKIYSDSNIYQKNFYFIENNTNLDLDLRGGGFLVPFEKCLIFSDSKGRLIYTAFNDNNDINIEEIQLGNNSNRLGAPYNKILMPFGFIFFLSSPFADAMLLSYDQKKITDKIVSYSPIVNFHLVNDNDIKKFAFTSGYGENSILSFAYDQFLFYEIPKNLNEIYDIDYMKSIDNHENNYTQYILCKLKNQKLVVFQNLNQNLFNCSNNIDYNKDSNIINFGEININSNNEKVIILIFENELKLYAQNFNILANFNNNFYNKNFIIKEAKVGENFILLYNSNEKRYILLGLYNDKIKTNNRNNNNIIEIMIRENLYIRYKELTNLLYKDINDFISVSMVTKLYLNKYNFLLIYRNNMILEIYDISEFLEYKDNMIIEDNENENNFKLILKSSTINYFPAIILDDNKNLNLLYRSISNPNIDFSESINKLLNIEKENSNNLVNNNDLSLKSSLSFSSDSPDFVYLESLGNICILTLTFKSGFLLIYTLYISEMVNENKEIKSIGFKKNRIERLIDINYRELFRLNLDNLFIPFNNINKKTGILFNLENNRKIIYEINGELCVLKMNIKKNSNFSGFCDFNSEELNNCFMIAEEGSIKYYSLYNNYNLSNYSLLIKSIKINRFPVLLTYTPEYINALLSHYSYIMIEKEMISPNKFLYFMTLRREEKQAISEIQFEPNEAVTECNVIDLPINIRNANNTKKYIVVGINIINEESGEDSFINAKIKFYTKDNDIYQLVTEKNKFKGIITMIISYHNLILVAEGSKVNIYQFNPEGFIMTKTNSIENKNLPISYRISSKLLLTGDIIDSLNYIYMTKNTNNTNLLDIYVASKDNYHIKLSTCNIWNIHKKNCCISFDEDNNGYIYLLQENHPIRICDFNINKNINEIRINYFFKQNDYFSFYYSSINGSIGFINHIENDIYEKLSYLCDFIYYHFPFNSGVNPKLYYTFKNKNIQNNNYHKHKGRFIDFNMLDIFLKMSDKFQDIICSNILGVEKNVLIKSIYDLID